MIFSVPRAFRREQHVVDIRMDVLESMEELIDFFSVSSLEEWVASGAFNNFQALFIT